MSASNEQANKPKKQMRVLVIQLARLGDTIQSLMALRAAKQLYPEMEIHFLVRERFSSAAKRVPWIKEVITLPTDRILEPVLKGQQNEAQALAGLARWLSPMIHDSWDMIINWTYSDASSYLTALIPARIKLGYSRRRDTTLSATDGWSHFIQGVVQGGVEQNIHLTDILTTQLLTALQIHLGEPADEGNSAVTSKAFFSLDLTGFNERDLGLSWRDPSRKWLGIQLGTGYATKNWSPERWSKFASYVLSRHPECNIVLLGGQEEAELAKRFYAELPSKLRDSKQIVSLIGRTPFDAWASIVSKCHWILAGDTAVIHLASVLGTRVLNVSVGPVRHAETGPYGNGHYVVTSAQACAACESGDFKTKTAHTCGESITAEAVYAAWSYASSEWAHRRQIGLENHYSQLGWSSELGNVRVYRSKIRNANDGGGVVYEALIQRSLRIQDWNAQVMGHVARAWYCGWVPPIGQEVIRSTVSPTLIHRLRKMAETSDVLLKICDEAKRTATTLQLKSATMRSDKIMGLQQREQLRDLGRKLLELDQLVDRLVVTEPTLRGFNQMSKVLMHNLHGDHLSELGKETAEAYRQLHQGITILKDWIQHTLKLAKPVALPRAPLLALEAKKDLTT